MKHQKQSFGTKAKKIVFWLVMDIWIIWMLLVVWEQEPLVYPLIEKYSAAIVNQAQAKETKIEKVKSSTIRTTTAYNAGVPHQTDMSPCITGNGENLCTALAKGYKRCAANFVPFGTRLRIQNYGICTVTDRMNARYPQNVDIAMMADEIARAKKFGAQRLLVEILE